MQQGGKKGRGPKAGARAQPDANKERMLYFLACLVGQTVTVKLKNQTIYEGVFHSCSTEGDLSITLKSARKVPTGNGKSGEVKDELVVAGKEFLQVSAANVPPEPKQHSAFKTDGEIAEGWGEGRNRELVAWKSGGEASAPAGVSLNLESGGRQIGTWNQFEYNEKQFGITSTYSEDLYTTKLDPSKIPEQKRKDAERIAREIESGQSYGRIEEGVNDDVDEEAQFSAVGSSQVREPVFHRPLTMENLSHHAAASGLAREHMAKRYLITAYPSRAALNFGSNPCGSTSCRGRPSSSSSSSSSSTDGSSSESAACCF